MAEAPTDFSSMEAALAEAVSLAGGPKSLGEKLHISHQAVIQWRICPPLRVLAVEEHSGVSRHKLRPDVYGAQEGVAA